MTRQSPLLLEELDARLLPSTIPLPQIAPAPSALLPGPIPPLHVLSGQGEGTFSTPAIQSGAGTDYSISGEGQFAALGQVVLHGGVHSVGFIQHGHAAGILTLTNSRGSLTLALRGPDQPGFSALPEQFSYIVTNGTGAYAHLSDQGTLALVLATQPAVPDGTHGPHGAFALVAVPPSSSGAALDGALSGHLIANRRFPDGGASYRLTGAGRLAGAGPVSLTGSLQGVGFIVSGHATGELTLADAHGSLTLELRGPSQRGFSPLPDQFSFQVTAATGAYAHVPAGGTLTTHLDPQDSTFTLVVLCA
jgi:hypothetical protein